MSALPKIAINGTYLQKQASGLGVFTSNLISKLMNFSEFDYGLYSYADDFRNLYPDNTIPVTDTLSPDRGFTGHLKRLWWYQTNLKRQLVRQNADLFYSPVNEGMLFSRVPQIVTVHDLIPLKYPELSPKWQYYHRYVLPLLLKQSRIIICISEHTKKDLITSYQLDPESIRVVYNGFNRDLFFPRPNPVILQKYGLDGLDKYFLYVGDMRFYKNLGNCLKAFDRLPVNDCKFVITGKKDDLFYPEIKRQTKQLSAQDRIIFLDYVPDDDLPGLYSQAQGLVFASLYEGFGLPVLEAMACACPVIASDRTSIPEVGGDSVLYVNPLSVEDIAKAMYQILTNPDLRNSLSKKGSERAKLFSWDRTAKGVKQVFEECLFTK